MSRASALINIQYQYEAVLILILNMVHSRHGDLVESRSPPRGLVELQNSCSHCYRHLRDPWRGVVDVVCSLDSAKASEASYTTFDAISLPLAVI